MPEPMYKRVAEDLRSKIESAQIAPGSQLPTELELMEDYGERFGDSSGRGSTISRNTVRDAIKLLVARGLVVTRPGKGTLSSGRSTPSFRRCPGARRSAGKRSVTCRGRPLRVGGRGKRAQAGRDRSARGSPARLWPGCFAPGA